MKPAFWVILVVLFTVESMSAQDFSLVLLPDAQNETQFYPQVLASQTNWVVQNQAALNIQALLGLGDIVNDGASATQEQSADAAIRSLDNAGIPYFLAIGNHDYDGATPRNATTFNQWFGPARYANYPYYMGNYPTGSNENFYGVLTISGQPYLFLVLEFAPRDATLAWAASVIAANPDKLVIVITHSYMFYDNTRVDQCDTHDMSSDNSGDAVWAKLTSQYPNIIMVVSGHVTSGNAGRRADLGVNGNLVNQMFSNYQTVANGGNGWLRILKFHPSQNTIDVLTYSPFLNSYQTDAANQFTVYYQTPMLSAGGQGTVSGLVRNASSCAAIPGATISVQGTTTTTNSGGQYSVTLPIARSVPVSASVSGFGSVTQNAVINEGYSTDLNFFLNATAPPPPPGCVINPSNRTVTICTPANNATSGSPVSVVSQSTDSSTVKSTQIFVDGLAVYTAATSSLNTSVPMKVGSRRLTVQSTDASGTFKQTIYVNVATTTPNVSLTPNTLQFGNINLGSTSTPQAVTLTSVNPTTVASLTTTGDFSETDNCVASLAAGGSCTINVIFSPTASGVRTGMISISDSDPSSPQTIALSGTGVALSSTGCTPGTASPSVTICAPTANLTVASPLQVTAATTDTNPVILLQIYIDGAAVYTVKASSLQASIPLKTGAHRLTVQAKDSTGMIFKQTMSLTVQ
jgi:hypothetical protein